MPTGKLFLCSQLMRVSTGRGSTIGNLEDIRPDKCTVSVEALPPIGAKITMQCIECPLGKKSCTDCRFTGRVQCHENDPVLGYSMQVEFEGRMWSALQWHPQHLTDINNLRRPVEPQKARRK